MKKKMFKKDDCIKYDGKPGRVVDPPDVFGEIKIILKTGETLFVFEEDLKRFEGDRENA